MIRAAEAPTREPAGRPETNIHVIQPPPNDLPHAHDHENTEPIPFHQRLIHALCLVLTPLLIFRLLSWILVKYKPFPDLVKIPAIRYLKDMLEATPYYSNNESGDMFSYAFSQDPLLMRIVNVLHEELGLGKDLWVTRALAVTMTFLFSFMSSMLLSLSASFHFLCFVLIIGMKWSTISKFVVRCYQCDTPSLGVF